MKQDLLFEQLQIQPFSFKAIEKKMRAYIEELKAAKDFETGFKVLKKYERYMSKLTTNFTLISIRFTLNTVDEVVAKYQDKVDEISPLISNLSNEWNKVLVKVPYRKQIEEKYTPYYFEMIENSLKSFDEKIIPEMIEINKLTSQHDKIMGSAKIEFRGGIYNIPQMGKFANSPDRETRREASIKVDEFFAEHEQEIGDIYGKLVELRDQSAKKLGFKDFTRLGYLSLGRVDYDEKMVESYRKQIESEVVPVAQKLYKSQAKRLEIPFKKMMSYDYNLFYLDGNPKLAGDPDYLVKSAQKMYHEMSAETGEFFDFMINHHLLDLVAREGKQPGGYMTFLDDYKYPFIFANFNGTEHDVNTLTHEVGHAFQGYLSRNIKPSDFRSPTLETCEIHSMSMEFFAWPWINLFFGKDADKYRYSHLVDSIEFLPYGASIDEFQHWVYAHPHATHDERCAAYKAIEEKYLPHKKYPKEMKIASKGGWWMRQGHVFDVPFYYIDYTLAQVCAFQFFEAMNKNHDKAWKKYVKLCKIGGRFPFVHTLAKVHLKNPFEEGNLRKIIRPLKKVLAQFNPEQF